MQEISRAIVEGSLESIAERMKEMGSKIESKYDRDAFASGAPNRQKRRAQEAIDRRNKSRNAKKIP